ncbi:hypothetical protein AnigIFM63326_001910 [Aspergillus niger]|nr:hypothetical protein AnigIFM63326_001910 [Aspergillus niger]
MAALFFATHQSTPQPQLWNPSFSSPGHQPQSIQITRENAQFILPTDACVHVGNLSSGVCPEILRHELEQLFFQFGKVPCSSSYQAAPEYFSQRSSSESTGRKWPQYGFLINSTSSPLSDSITGNRVEPVVHREERAGLTTSPLYMPSMAIPSCQPIAYGPAMMSNWPPALPGYGSLYIPPPPPPPPASVACEADQGREEEYIKDNRSNLPCDMLLSTGRTVRDYVNEMKRLRGIDLSDETTRELILELEEEARDAGLLPVLTSKPD